VGHNSTEPRSALKTNKSAAAASPPSVRKANGFPTNASGFLEAMPETLGVAFAINTLTERQSLSARKASNAAKFLQNEDQVNSGLHLLTQVVLTRPP